MENTYTQVIGKPVESSPEQDIKESLDDYITYLYSDQPLMAEDDYGDIFADTDYLPLEEDKDLF